MADVIFFCGNSSRFAMQVLATSGFHNPSAKAYRPKVSALFCAVLAAKFCLSPSGAVAAESDPTKAPPAASLSAGVPEQPVELEDLTVTASAGGVAQQIKDAPASISVITHDDLVQKPYRDVADALSSVPGVVTSVGGDHKEINIRGMGSAYTLYLIDGKRVDSRDAMRLYDGYGQMNAWMPPVSAIERIEVVRGPMSALYGSDAIGGVVNVITRKVSDEWGGEVSTDETFQEHSKSGDIYQQNFYLTGPLKKDLLGMQLYGNYSKRDEDDIYNGYRESGRGNVTGKLAFTPTLDHDIVFEVAHSNQRVQQDVGKSISPECTYYSGCPQDYDQTVKQDKYSISHTGRWSFGTSDTYIQEEEYDISSLNINLKNIDARSSLAMPLGDVHMVTVGVSYNKKELHDGWSNQISDLKDIERTERSIFAEDQWYLFQDFSLTTGLRLDDDDQFGKNWSPRVYGNWNFTQNWTLKGGVSAGFKAPSITEISRDFGSISYVGNAYGNPDLKPEKSINQEIGIIYADGGVSAGLTLFNNKFKDKITTVPCPADQCSHVPNQYGGYPLTYANVGEAITRGVEASLSVPLAEEFSLDNSYTYTYSRQDSGEYKGQPLTKLPKHVFSSTLNYKPSQEFSSYLRVTYRGKDSENVGGSEATIMPVEAPSYTLVDVGGVYQVSKSLSLRGGVYNLGDKTIRYDDYGYVEDGRRFYVGATLKF